MYTQVFVLYVNVSRMREKSLIIFSCFIEHRQNERSLVKITGISFVNVFVIKSM